MPPDWIEFATHIEGPGFARFQRGLTIFNRTGSSHHCRNLGGRMIRTANPPYCTPKEYSSKPCAER